MVNEIKFYKTGDSNGYLSNFYPAPIKVHGKKWPTSEHFFQAQKFDDNAYQEKIRLTKSPMKAAQLGRSRKVAIKSQWETIKDDVMREAVLAKFSQHKDLAKKLISTDNATLIEHTTNDSYWGNGGDNSGKNMLGNILMEIREKFKNHYSN